MTGEPETPYTETELLLAVLNDDDERACALADDMLPGERRTLLDRLVEMTRVVLAADERAWVEERRRQLDES